MMKILIAGDFCPKDRVKTIIEEGDYSEVFEQVKSNIEASDYSILNFECPVSNNYAKPIKKLGPNLKCSAKAVEAISSAGFRCVTLANNHFLDYGEEGVVSTLMACKEYGIDAVGGGTTLQEASTILYKEINGKVLAIINCCEHEFSIATEDRAGSNPLNPIRQYYAIKEARQIADIVLVIVHGGFEEYQLPSLRMKETYRFFIDLGADVVINHHQHCYSGYEVYRDKPIFYGLGNFCFDWDGKRNDAWNEGYMVMLSVSDKISYEIIPYIQCNDFPSVSPMIGNKKIEFENKMKYLNDIISDDKELIRHNNAYLKKSIPNYIFCFDPFYNNKTKLLYEKGLFPSFIKRRRYALIDYIMCESHLEKVIMAIREAFK